MSFKEKFYIDPNAWEKIEVKKLSSIERKEYLKKFTKWTRAALLSTLLVASTTSAQKIDISKYPEYAENFFSKAWKWLKKNVHVSYNRTATDWNSHYNTNYYERYNSHVQNVENTELRGVDSLNVTWWALYMYGQKLSLVSASNIIESDEFLKENDLDEVVININWVPFKAKPKFLRLNFEKNGRRWIVGYEAWKTVTLVYVSYLNKIKVLWTIDQYAWYINENNPREYEVLVNNKKRLYEKISNILWCKQCNLKRDYSWNIYFYSNGRNVWTLTNMWNEKILTKWNKVLAKIIQHWNNIIMTDPFWNILYKSNWQEVLDMELPTVGERIVLSIKN